MGVLGLDFFIFFRGMKALYRVTRQMSSSVKEKSKPKDSNDPRYIQINKMLFDPNFQQFIPKERIMNSKKIHPKDSPVYVGDQVHLQQIDLIERAWCYLKLKEQQEFNDKVSLQYEMIRKAMLVLAKRNNQLYQDALVKNEVELFPKSLRIQTETYSSLGWDYNMDRNQ